MTELPVISALKKKRQELSGQLMTVYVQERKLRAEIKTIDESLHIFGCHDTDYKAIVRGSFRRLFARNELPRLVRVIIQERPDLKSNNDIALEVMARKSWDKNDKVLRKRICLKIRDYMNRADG